MPAMFDKVMHAWEHSPLAGQVRRISPRQLDPDYLFDGDDTLFKRVVRGARCYGEYGCGKATGWVLAHAACPVLSVDTSGRAVARVARANAANRRRLTIAQVDLGPLGRRRRPLGYAHRAQFAHYVDFLWHQPEKPEVVLIDGSFRVCCFLTALAHAREGSYLLFDDYVGEARYRLVEEYVPCLEVCGRQGLFQVPARESLDLQRLDQDVAQFRFVLD
ncbi:hypothetical protein HT136_05745 [Novosphingobium profundi]|uniref:hypothetical protein n=1 Tax=Novosphingobium profundi TaxID=1774954 RepID=UPI001BD9EBEA|nr:hypothetical protein [Novosphingobium profundi]MBT0667868.1 hypothetical protein [Novosphingobium profundi]